MDLEFYGANTIRLETKKVRIIVDDTLATQGKKSITKADDIAVQTDFDIPSAEGARLLLDAPGEFEVGDVSIRAVAVRGHRDEEGKRSSTVFLFSIGNIEVAVAGHIHPDLSDAEIEQIGEPDVLFLPVGGFGFTLDPEGALKVIKNLSPNVVIPTYYQVAGIKTEMPQYKLDEVLTKLGMTAEEPQTSLKLKDLDFTSEQTKLIILQPK